MSTEINTPNTESTAAVQTASPVAAKKTTPSKSANSKADAPSTPKRVRKPVKKASTQAKSVTKANTATPAKTAKPTKPATTAKPVSSAKPAKPAKPAKSAKPAKPAKPATQAKVKPVAEPKTKKPKLIRDSFTFPKDEYQAIAALKVKALSLKHSAKKSEILRAGLMLISSLNDKAFLAALNKVPALKTGRPAKS